MAILVLLWYFLWPAQGLTHTPEIAYPQNGNVGIHQLGINDSISFRFSSKARHLESIEIYTVVEQEDSGGLLYVMLSADDGTILKKEAIPVASLKNAEWNSVLFRYTIKKNRWYWLTLVLEGDAPGQEDAKVDIAVLPFEQLADSYRMADGKPMEDNAEGIPVREAAVCSTSMGTVTEATLITPLTAFVFRTPVSSYVRISLMLLMTVLTGIVISNVWMEKKLTALLLPVLSVWFLLAIPDIVYELKGISLDLSWRYFLNIANTEGYRFGKDVFFTYGPLGFLCYMINRGADLQFYMGLVIWGMIFACHIVMLFWIRQLYCESKIGMTQILLSFFSCVLLLSEPVTENYMVYILMLAAVLWEYGKKRAAIISNFMLLLMFFAKFSSFTSSIAFLLFYIFYNMIVTRRWKSSALLLPALIASPACYLLYNPSLQGLHDYVFGILRISSGWMKTQQWDNAFSASDWRAFFIIVASYIAIIVITTLMNNHRTGLLLGGGASLFMAYKYGVTAHGIKPSIWMTSLIFSAVFLALPMAESRPADEAAPSEKTVPSEKTAPSTEAGTPAEAVPSVQQSSQRRKSSRRLIVLMTTLCVLITGLQVFLLDSSFTTVGNAMKDKFCSVRHITRTSIYPDEIRSRSFIPEEFLERIGNETVTSYPWETGFRTIYPWLHVVYSPSVQNCNEFIPWLDHLSALYFAGDSAPSYILLKNDVIFDHIRYLENPLTWEAIKDHYSVVGQTDDMYLLYADKTVNEEQNALLEEAYSGKTFSAATGLHLLESRTYGKEETITVPPGAAYMVIHTDYSPAGKIKDFFWRAGSVNLLIHYSNGKELNGTIVPTNLISGTSTSMLPQTLSEVKEILNSADPSGLPVMTDFTFSGVGLKAWNESITVDWYTAR